MKTLNQSKERGADYKTMPPFYICLFSMHSILFQYLEYIQYIYISSICLLSIFANCCCKIADSPILNFLVPLHCCVSSSSKGAGKSLRVSIGEGDFHPLPLGKASCPIMGFFKFAILPGPIWKIPCWTIQTDSEFRIFWTLPVPPPPAPASPPPPSF